MSQKAKRGLGLLVIAVIGVLVVSIGKNSEVAPVEALGWLVVAGGVVAGLPLLAWGLLRD